MKAQYINPFLSASIAVIEMMLNIKPAIGKLSTKTIRYTDDRIWLKIGVLGQFQSDIIFSFPIPVTLRIVSGMMGGAPVHSFDELCQSAVAELSNMISGNASTMLYNDGVVVDITPPCFLNSETLQEGKQTFLIPLHIDTIGEFQIHIIA